MAPVGSRRVVGFQGRVEEMRRAVDDHPGDHHPGALEPRTRLEHREGRRGQASGAEVGQTGVDDLVPGQR